jgi:ParB family chromosome partitioning protein
MSTSITNATEYRDLPLALLTESTTNPRRTFEEDALKELAAYVPRHIIGVLWR